MFKHLFAILLFVHGLLHITGFAGLFGFITLKEKSPTIVAKSYRVIAGVCWLITSLLFMWSSILFYTQWEFYWVILFHAFIFSQILIVICWPLAKYGTMINLIVLVVITVEIGSYSYDQKVADEIEFLKKGAQHKNEIITEEKIERLPPPIKRWMIQSGVVGKREPSLVHITQRGALRSKENDAWAEFTAQQCFSLKPPAFVWKANIQMNEIIEIEGRDKLENGHGNMLIKAESIFPIANALGKEIDQATFVRFLAEISWFPQAALKDYITWKALDSNSAEAAFSYGKYFGYRYFYFQ